MFSIITTGLQHLQTKCWGYFLQIFGNLFAAISIVFVLFLLKHVFRRKAYSRLLPGKKTRLIDIFGNASDIPLRKSPRTGYSLSVYAMQILNAHAVLFGEKGLFSFWISYVPVIFITKAEGVEALLSGTKHMEKSSAYNWLHPWLGTGLLTSHGSKWKSRRKLLTPSFHFEILKDFLVVFNEQSQILVQRFRKEIEKDFTDIVVPITQCSLDIICETALGVRIGAQENIESQYVQSVTRTSAIIMERMINCLYWSDITFGFTGKGREFRKHVKILHDFTRSVIMEKKRKLLKGDKGIGKGKRKAMMDLLLEQHIRTKLLTEEDIREEVDTFTFEGHDTTSTAMCWALYLIGLHEDVQEKVRQELDRIFGDDDRYATTDDLKDMEYLNRVIKESQRLYPSVPFIGRKAGKDLKICGYTIPKGVTCDVSTYYLHRDETVFPNAEKFDPDRFLPENCLNRHPYAYIPFSAGQRNCIGQRFAVMEEKIVVSTVLRNYTIESLDQRDRVLPAPELILRPSMSLRIRIRPRHGNTE